MCYGTSFHPVFRLLTSTTNERQHFVSHRHQHNEAFLTNTVCPVCKIVPENRKSYTQSKAVNNRITSSKFELFVKLHINLKKNYKFVGFVNNFRPSYCTHIYKRIFKDGKFSICNFEILIFTFVQTLHTLTKVCLKCM